MALPTERRSPLVESTCVDMADVAFLLLVAVFFAALALIARGLDR